MRAGQPTTVQILKSWQEQFGDYVRDCELNADGIIVNTGGHPQILDYVIFETGAVGGLQDPFLNYPPDDAKELYTIQKRYQRLKMAYAEHRYHSRRQEIDNEIQAAKQFGGGIGFDVAEVKKELKKLKRIADLWTREYEQFTADERQRAQDMIESRHRMASASHEAAMEAERALSGY